MYSRSSPVIRRAAWVLFFLSSILFWMLSGDLAKHLKQFILGLGVSVMLLPMIYKNAPTAKWMVWGPAIVGSALCVVAIMLAAA